jgi:hypothetical protein
MATQRRRDLSDQNDTVWTIDQAAEHFGVTRGAILRWIREENLTVYGTEKRLARADILAAFQTRRQRQLATRLQKRDHRSAPE